MPIEAKKELLDVWLMVYFLRKEVLYKRNPDMNLLRCVDAEEVEKIMSEVHAGVCGPHMNGYVIAKKILLEGYYWLTME